MASVVLDSPFPLVDFDPWATAGRREPPAAGDTHLPAVGELPPRSSSPGGRAGVAGEAPARRAGDGSAFDSLGDPHTVHVDEATLIQRLLSDWGGFTAQSEVAAAARALRRGDPAPLLRLAAEPLVTFPPRAAGTLLRRAQRRPLLQRPAASSGTRGRPSRSAGGSSRPPARSLDPRQFAPFSLDGWVSPAPLGAWLPDPCIGWPSPTHERERPVPDGATRPRRPRARPHRRVRHLPAAGGSPEPCARSFPNNRLIDIGSPGTSRSSASTPNAPSDLSSGSS